MLKVNEKCAQRIDVNIATLKKEVGLGDEDIVRIPALFDGSNFGGDDRNLQVATFFLGLVNNLVPTGHDTSVAPNPWGPVIKGKDILVETLKANYAKLGIDLKLVDDWNTHHNNGREIHCGTNSIRETSARWW